MCQTLWKSAIGGQPVPGNLIKKLRRLNSESFRNFPDFVVDNFDICTIKQDDYDPKMSSYSTQGSPRADTANRARHFESAVR